MKGKYQKILNEAFMLRPRTFKWAIDNCPSCPTSRSSPKVTIFIIWYHIEILNFTPIKNAHINYHVGGLIDEFCKYLGKRSCKLNFSALYQTRKDRIMVNKLGRCFWCQSNCNLISTSNLGFLIDITNSIIDAIIILIVCLQKKTIQSLPFPLLCTCAIRLLNQRRWRIH